MGEKPAYKLRIFSKDSDLIPLSGMGKYYERNKKNYSKKASIRGWALVNYNGILLLGAGIVVWRGLESLLP